MFNLFLLCTILAFNSVATNTSSSESFDFGDLGPCKNNLKWCAGCSVKHSTADNDVCLLCGFAVADFTNGKCLEVTKEADEVEDCLSYYSEGSSIKCSFCKFGYYVSGNTCKECDIDDCLDCETSSRCEICKDNYKLKTDGTCDTENKLTCSSNCKYCENASDSDSEGTEFVNCVACDDDYALRIDKLPLTCTKEENCFMSNGTDCIFCHPGYDNQNGTCKKSSFVDSVLDVFDVDFSDGYFRQRIELIIAFVFLLF